MLAKSRTRLRGEKGIALVLSLLVLFILSFLSAALMVTTLSETKISSTQLQDVQALFVAEAGIAEAIYRLNLRYPTEVHVNGETFNAAIKDTGHIDPRWVAKIFLCAHPPPPCSGSTEHTATIQPEEDWLKYSHPTDPELVITIKHKLDLGPGIEEYQLPVEIITVSGRKGAAARHVLAEARPEGWETNYGVLCDGPVTISGGPEILGTVGNVHSNSDLTIKGNAHISGKATASGEVEISGNPAIDGGWYEGVPEQWVPDVRARDYLYMADYLLCADGLIRDAETDTLIREDLGWEWSSDKWRVNNDWAASGVYYADGNVTISGNPGTPEAIWQATIIATGSISVAGNPFMGSNYGGILLVAEGDADHDGVIDGEPVIEISGTPEQETANYDGAILSAGSIKTTGDPAVQGCLIAEGGLDIPLTMGGNVSITYNGERYMFPYVVYHLAAWREK